MSKFLGAGIGFVVGFIITPFTFVNSIYKETNSILLTIGCIPAAPFFTIIGSIYGLYKGAKGGIDAGLNAQFNLFSNLQDEAPKTERVRLRESRPIANIFSDPHFKSKVQESLYQFSPIDESAHITNETPKKSDYYSYNDPRKKIYSENPIYSKSDSAKVSDGSSDEIAKGLIIGSVIGNLINP